MPIKKSYIERRYSGEKKLIRNPAEIVSAEETANFNYRERCNSMGAGYFGKSKEISSIFRIFKGNKDSFRFFGGVYDCAANEPFLENCRKAEV